MDTVDRTNQHMIENGDPHDPVVNSIREMLQSLSPLSTECCIYRVPEKLRIVNVEAYTPRFVSIGPFHHGKEGLQAMEEHKLRYLQTFLRRTSLSLEDYVKVLRTWEERARQCYAETIKLSSDEFVKMILVDGSFIVELLLRSCFPRLIDDSDRIFNKPRMIDDVCRDMILLENQLPFFVLEGMFNFLSVYYREETSSILNLIHGHFKYLLKNTKFPDAMSSRGVNHFVDFLRVHYLSPSPGAWRNVQSVHDFPPSATELHEAGVKFKIGTSSCSLDVKFTNGILEIPSLEIDDITETLFRNLIAFEQCHCIDKYFIQYMALLSSMINTSKDVDLLINYRIITSMLGNSEDVSTLFNNICKEVVFGHRFYFSSLCQNLNAYCRTPWHKWKATLKRDYFNTPWVATSVFAATALLVLTLIQSVCSILSL